MGIIQYYSTVICLLVRVYFRGRVQPLQDPTRYRYYSPKPKIRAALLLTLVPIYDEGAEVRVVRDRVKGQGEVGD
jgi:hypothetical protein